MAVLVFDYGRRHIGVAVAEPRANTASPLTTARAKAGTPLWHEIDHLVEQWRPSHLVVGLPLNMDDTESPMSDEVRRFGTALEARYDIEVDYADERLSTFEAGERQGGGRPDHALAAVVIAETWMATKRDSR